MYKMKKVLFVGLIVFLFASAFVPLWSITLTPEFLALRAGALLSLLFSFFPKLNVWYAGKPDSEKKLFMVGLLLLITIALGVGMCLNILTIVGISCEPPAINTLLNTFLLAVVANQSVYTLTPLPKYVQLAAAEADKKDAKHLKE